MSGVGWRACAVVVGHSHSIVLCSATAPVLVICRREAHWQPSSNRAGAVARPTLTPCLSHLFHTISYRSRS